MGLVCAWALRVRSYELRVGHDKTTKLVSWFITKSGHFFGGILHVVVVRPRIQTVLAFWFSIHGLFDHDVVWRWVTPTNLSKGLTPALGSPYDRHTGLDLVFSGNYKLAMTIVMTMMVSARLNLDIKSFHCLAVIMVMAVIMGFSWVMTVIMAVVAMSKCEWKNLILINFYNQVVIVITVVTPLE